MANPVVWNLRKKIDANVFVVKLSKRLQAPVKQYLVNLQMDSWKLVKVSVTMSLKYNSIEFR